MDQWKESQLNRLADTTDLDNAYQIALGFAKNIGFKFFAFSTTYQTKNNQYNTVGRNNYPAGWNDEYERKNLRSVDPVVAHCNHSMLPILWSANLFSNVPWLWEALEAQGFQHGWSQSLNDEENGSCSILSLARSHCAITALELYENLGFSVFMCRHLHALVAQSLPKRLTIPSPPLCPLAKSKYWNWRQAVRRRMRVPEFSISVRAPSISTFKAPSRSSASTTRFRQSSPPSRKATWTAPRYVDH